MNTQIYYEFFEFVIEEMISCLYCENTEIKEEDICEECELSIELTEALLGYSEA